MKRYGDESRRIVMARSSRPDSDRLTSEKYLSGDELIDRNQSKINDICLTSRANEELWVADKKKFTLIDTICLAVGLSFALISLGLSTWLLFFDKKFQMIKLMVKSFSVISSDLVVLLPIFYFSSEAIWTFLEIIQIFFSFQINKILIYTEKKEAKKRAPKKNAKDGEKSVKIYDDYLTVSSQSTRILETIHRLQLRIHLRNKFRSLHKWFIIYSVLINLIFMLSIIAIKILVAAYLIHPDVRQDLGINLSRKMFQFIQTNGSNYNIISELETSSSNLTTNASLDQDANLLGLFSNMNSAFKCCYFASQEVNATNKTYFIQGPNQCPAQDLECFRRIEANILFYIIAIFVVFVFTSVVKLVTQIVLAFNLHWILFRKLINKPFEEENRLLKEYNSCASKIFNTNAMKKIELADETIANQYNALMSSPKPNEQAKYINDDDDDNYDEIPPDVRNTLEEFDKSFEDSEIVPLNQNRQSTQSQRYQNIDDESE